MKSPFSDAHFMATGGITPDQVDAYLAAGADVVRLGSSIASPRRLATLAGLLQRPNASR